MPVPSQELPWKNTGFQEGSDLIQQDDQRQGQTGAGTEHRALASILSLPSITLPTCNFVLCSQGPLNKDNHV